MKKIVLPIIVGLFVVGAGGSIPSAAHAQAKAPAQKDVCAEIKDPKKQAACVKKQNAKMKKKMKDTPKKPMKKTQ